MFISPLNISPLSLKNTLANIGFSIKKSFLFDGIAKRFSLGDATLLNSACTGTNKQFTLNAVVKRSSLGHQTIFAKYASGLSFRLRFGIGANVDRVDFEVVDSLAGKFLTTTNTFTSLTEWLCISVVYDGVTPANSKIFVNGVDEAISRNTLGNNIDTSTDVYEIGVRNFANFFNGYINHVSVIDRTIDLSEHQSWYNLGEPLSSQDFYGSNCKYFFNPENSGDTAQFSVTDSVNSISADSAMMVDSDKTNTHPY